MFKASPEGQTVQYPVLDAPNESVNTLVLKHVIVPGGQAWVEKKNENCVSNNPDDCYMWCSVMREEESQALDVVANYSAVDSTLIKWESYAYPSSHKDFVGSCQVVCSKTVNESLITEVSALLASQGYDIDPAHYRYDLDFFVPLEQYQLKHNLPIGQLNLATLIHMGVSLSM